ncbi:MAG: hypothetical protein GX786_03075 [Clostridiales bacterium]|nr:hypothetical protein [Clostridiales bacterium]
MLEKCPRCELNYVRKDEKICKVCMRELKGDKPKEELELCSVCNESPALPGKDICLFCLKEMQSNEQGEEDKDVSEDSPLDMDTVSSMDEIIPQITDDIPEKEFGEIESELSLESVREEEDYDEEEDEY